jgi:hypothetical protein
VRCSDSTVRCLPSSRRYFRPVGIVSVEEPVRREAYTAARVASPAGSRQGERCVQEQRRQASLDPRARGSLADGHAPRHGHRRNNGSPGSSQSRRKSSITWAMNRNPVANSVRPNKNPGTRPGSLSQRACLRLGCRPLRLCPAAMPDRLATTARAPVPVLMISRVLVPSSTARQASGTHLPGGRVFVRWADY